MSSSRDLDLNTLERKRKVLPLVIKIRAQIDQLFIRYVGPIGKSICDDCYEQWVASGSIGPTGLRRYIDMISLELPDQIKMPEFKQRAVSLIRLF
jgi:hypothetical protein